MHTERDFENDIEAALLKDGSYLKGDPAGYDAERALFTADTVAFVAATQQNPGGADRQSRQGAGQQGGTL